MPLELSDLYSVRKFCSEFLSKYNQLHILIANAGLMAPPKRLENKDGLELQFATNHLGHFYLIHLLLNTLKSSQPSRIVIVSSMGHKWGNMHFDNLQFTKWYNPKMSYE